MKPALILTAVAAAAAAAAPGAAQTASERITRIVVYGTDPCPRGSGDDVVICARRPETERYRVPRELRDDELKDDPESTSWAARAESLEFAGRGGIQSCSTIGPGGFTGCWAELMRAARNDRRVEGEPGR
jgi:hypothetical protein